jgi:serine/threonine-protein kinase
VLHQIGAGTLGPVFRAYDSTRERLVAVKLFKLDLPPERGHQLVAEFERLIAAGLSHSGLAAPLATGIRDVSAFLVQEYVAADSLDMAIREHGPASAANVLRVAAQLAGAFDYAAAVDVTHGALHPRDVLLSSDDTRLTGLGVTRALARIGVVAPVRRPYTAPERLAGGEWDRRADVFSLAALMHELMWGRRVSGLGVQASASLTEIAGADLSALRATFSRALAENPAERYGTALEFAEALEHACPDVAAAPAPVPAPKRRAVREDAPRLPLDNEIEVAQAFRPAEPAADLKVRTTPETSVAESETNVAQGSNPAGEAPDRVAQGFPPPQGFASVAQGFPPPLAFDAGELRRDTPKRDACEGGSPADLSMAAPGDVDEARYRDVEAAPAIVVPDIVRHAVAEAAPYEPPMAIPDGLMIGHDPEPFAALERSRSAIWPLALALVVGIAIGFAGGYGVGSREQPGTPAVTAAVPAAPAPAVREFTEGAVAAAPATPAPAPPSKSEVESQKSEIGNPKSEIRNPKSQANVGSLLIRSRPGGARVSVDGQDYGRTPATVRALARGAHRVTITHDGYATEERRFVITTSRPSQSMTVALVRPRAAASRVAQTSAAPAGRLTGLLAVDSRPAGAKVYLDGKLVGTTPISLPSVSAASHAIRLEHNGYRRWSSSVRVVAGEQNRVTASLER